MSSGNADEQSREQDLQIREGLYLIMNKKSRTTIDLYRGESASGTQVKGHERSAKDNIGNQLWIVKRDGVNNTYSLRNFQGGTCLDLFEGRRENGSGAVGWPRNFHKVHRLNQEWRIEEYEPTYYRIQCCQSGTYLEVAGGNPSNGTPITCSAAQSKSDHQLWSFELVSRGGPEITALFESWKPAILPRLLQPYKNSSQYFVLPSDLRKSIWQGTNLLRQPLRPHLFDYDDFVIRAKDAITVWARNRFQADVRGYSVLFGIIYGEAPKGPRAYNWCLAPDMFSLVFFDAQTGNEYGPAALDSFGFEPTFALF